MIHDPVLDRILRLLKNPFTDASQLYNFNESPLPLGIFYFKRSPRFEKGCTGRESQLFSVAPFPLVWENIKISILVTP